WPSPPALQSKHRSQKQEDTANRSIRPWSRELRCAYLLSGHGPRYTAPSRPECPPVKPVTLESELGKSQPRFPAPFCRCHPAKIKWPILLRYAPSAFECGLIIVGALGGPLGQLHLLAMNPLVGNQAQDVCNAVEARPFLVIGVGNVPGSLLCVGCFQH